MGEWIEADHRGEERKALRSLYKEFFYKNYGNEDLVCLKDITHDGTDDMIVIHAIGEQDYTGEVYTVDHGKIKKIYEKYGGTCHAGGFFNWYLIQNGDEWCLAEEVFGMWQGLGELEYVQYYLTNDGELKEVDCLVVPASDDEVDEEGYVKDDAFARYTDRLGELINRSDCLFCSYTEASVNPKMIDTNPEIVFKE